MINLTPLNTIYFDVGIEICFIFICSLLQKGWTC